jgi:predicted nucleotidyltransferase
VCRLLQPKVGWQNVGKSPPQETDGYVNEWDIGVRYTGQVDYSQPVEAVIPGATGRLLAALARVEAEVPVSILASIAGVGRTRASGIIGELSDLGIVERREVGRTVLVSLARHSVAGELIDRLAHLGSEVIARLRALASELEPAPETVLVFGSFARGEADANSDLDVLAVRSPAADPEKWATALSVFAEQARELAGSPVQVLDYDLDGLRRKAGPKAKAGRDFWSAVRRDAIVLAGSKLDELIDSVR